jgi:hypothetical protein
MSKLTLQKDIVFRWVALLLAASLCAWSIGNLVDEAKPIRVEGSSVWCFHAEYESMELYKDSKPPSQAFIDIQSGGKVRVFEHCNPFYDN